MRELSKQECEQVFGGLMASPNWVESGLMSQPYAKDSSALGNSLHYISPISAAYRESFKDYVIDWGTEY